MQDSLKDNPWRVDSAYLLRHGSTLGLSYLGAYAIVLTDSVMIAWVGSAEFTGVSIGGLFYAVLLLFGMGCSYIVAPQVAEAVGRKRRLRISVLGAETVRLAALYAVAAVPVIYFGSIPLSWFPDNVEFMDFASVYLSIVCFAIAPQLVVVVIGENCVGHGKSQVVLFATVFAFLCNIAFNYLFIFVLGLGVAGVAASSVLTSVLSLGFAALLARRVIDFGALFSGDRRLRKAVRLRLLRLGLPLGLLEVTFFFLWSQMTVLVGIASPHHLPAHLILFQVTESLALLYIGYGDAMAARIGFYKGVGDGASMRRLVRVAGAMVGSMAAVLAFGLLLGSEHVFGFYARGKPDFADAGPVFETLVPLGATLQTFDAVHIVLICALRGLGDTRYLTVMSTLVLGSIGFCGGALAIHILPGGAVWVWVSIIVAVAVVIVLTLRRFRAIVPGQSR